MLNPTRFLFFVLSMGVYSMVFGAKETPLPPPPPMAQAASVSTYRGKSVDITLRALGRAPSQLKFLIRSQPRFGTLGEIRIVDRKSAVVTYTHNDRAGEVVDSFLFAAQANDSAVSASAQVTVTVSEEPSELTVVPAISFGQTFLGDSSRQEFTIANAGGGILEGKITVPAPWKLEGPGAYRLARGEEKSLSLSFTPDADRDFAGSMTFSSGSRAAVILTGRGVSPLEIKPVNGLEFITQTDSRIRRASLSLRNLTGSECKVEIGRPPQIAGPDRETLGPGETREIVFTTAPDFKSALSGDLSITVGSHATPVPFRIYAIPPILRAAPSGELDFGVIRTGLRYTRTFTVSNVGGTNASLTAKLPPDIILIPPPSSVVIAPGESRTFEAALERNGETPAGPTIVLEANGSEALTLAVKALTLPSKLPPVPEKPNKALPTSDAATRPQTASAPSPPLSDIPPIEEFRLNSVTKHEIEISWKKPPEAHSFIIERRDIVPDRPGSPVNWVEWKNISQSEKDGMVVARFQDLPAGSSTYIRITTVDAGGLRSASSGIIRLTTLPPTRFHLPWWLALPLIIVVAIAVWKLWLTIRAARYEDDAVRISRLEKR